jgi:hypothetical protein
MSANSLVSWQVPGVGNPTMFVQVGNVVIETEISVFFDAVENEEEIIEDNVVPSHISIHDHSVIPSGLQKHKRFFAKRGIKRLKTAVARLVPRRARRRKVGSSDTNVRDSGSYRVPQHVTPSVTPLSTPEALRNEVASQERARPRIHRSTELPVRFLDVSNNDPIEARKRYEATLEWRRKESIDTILLEAHPRFNFIKECYPQFFHLRGRNNELCAYEKPPMAKHQLLKESGITIEEITRWYALISEFGWQYLEPDDMQQSISVIDLNGIKVTDFVGYVAEITRKLTSTFSYYYPERSACVLIVNVPLWFNVIWAVIKNFVDEGSLQRVKIVGGGNKVLQTLLEHIPMENIPPEYGGTSMPLGQSPEEAILKAFMDHNNRLACGESVCRGVEGGCRFCTWRPVRGY